MNSFFLIRSLPPLRGKCRACEAIGAIWRTQVRIFKSCILCLDSSLRSKMTGKYLYCSVRNSFTCLLTLAPSVNLTVDTLAKAKRLTHFCSVAPLPEKWFACFPTSGDGFHFLCSHF